MESLLLSFHRPAVRAAAALVLLALLLLPGVPASSDAAMEPHLLSCGARLGAVLDMSAPGEFDAAAGKRHTLIKIYQSLANGDFWPGLAGQIDGRGAIEFLSLDPNVAGPGGEVGLNSCQVLNSAEADAAFLKFAGQIKDWGRPMLISTMGEMNGDWAAWSGAKNFGIYDEENDCAFTADPGDLYENHGCTEHIPACLDGPERYRDAYRHVYDLFAQQGVTNLKWVWVINHKSFPEADWSDIVNYYPGDGYVDVIAVDGYNWGDEELGGWQSFDQIFIHTLDRIKTLYPGKPVIIGEFGTVAGAGPTDRANWLIDAYQKMEARWPQVRAAVYFNEGQDGIFKLVTPEDQAGYRVAVTSPFWVGDLPACKKAYLPMLLRR